MTREAHVEPAVQPAEPHRPRGSASGKDQVAGGPLGVQSAPAGHESYLDRRNPTVKLVAAFGLAAALLFVFDPITPAVLYPIVLVVANRLGRIRPRRLAIAQVPFLTFALSLFLVNAVTRGGPVVLDWGWFTVTADGLSVGTSLALRTLVIGTCSVAFLFTTDATRLMTSLRQQLRLSPRVTYGLLAGYRLLDRLPTEWMTIRRAHAVRHPGPRGRPSRRPAALARAAFTLLVTAVRRGERMALALEARGLGGQPASTVWRPVPVTGADWAFLAAAAVVVAATLVGSAFAG